MTLRLLVLMLLSGPVAAQQWGQAQHVVEQWLQGQNLQENGLRLQVPDWVEDGAFVAIELQLEGAQPPVSLSLLRSGEADPRIATLELRAWEGPLNLSTRIRLPRSQQVIALVRDGTGRVWMAVDSVEVLASSCLTPSSGNDHASLGELQAWLEAQGSGLELRSLLRHPMETGRRLTVDSQLLPRNLISHFELSGAHGEILSIEAFEGLAANPYLRLLLPAGHTPLILRWVEVDGREYRRQVQLEKTPR